jgi:hypothetical protein
VCHTALLLPPLLPLLLQDQFLRTWFSCFLYGQLSWVQLARMHVSPATMPATCEAAAFFKSMLAAMLSVAHEPHCNAWQRQCHLMAECVDLHCWVQLT